MDSVGLKLRLRLTERNDLAAHYIHNDGSDGCRVGFASLEYAAGEGGRTRDGAIVCLREIFTAESENTYQRRLFHQNCGYAIAEIISFANEHTHT